jgi:hypothetical protein
VKAHGGGILFSSFRSPLDSQKCQKIKSLSRRIVKSKRSPAWVLRKSRWIVSITSLWRGILPDRRESSRW